MNEKFAKSARKFAKAFGLNAEGWRILVSEYRAANSRRRGLIRREIEGYTRKRRTKDTLEKLGLVVP